MWKLFDRQHFLKRLSQISWFGLLAFTLVFYYCPVNFGTKRLFLVLAMPTILIWASALLWSDKRRRWVPLLILGAVVVFLISPGRQRDAADLRQEYIFSLWVYSGTPYVWGGESFLGIDCSGLARQALIDAHMREAILGANPGQLRSAIELWWYDCSAQALKDEYRGWTTLLFNAAAINQIDPARLAPGDLAVTDDGVHVLIYLGDSEWIEADLTRDEVIARRVPVEGFWFKVPVSVMRWKRLETDED